jgi:hypothetical protein
MESLNRLDVAERCGIRTTYGTSELVERMINWGWIDGAGRTKTWDHWQRFAPKYQKEKE